jgi:hypothetical protein
MRSTRQTEIEFKRLDIRTACWNFGIFNKQNYIAGQQKDSQEKIKQEKHPRIREDRE